MKTIALGLLLAVTFCIGCATTYNITLNDSMVITAKGKPKLDTRRNLWIYTDASGKTNAVPAGRVTQIAPR